MGRTKRMVRDAFLISAALVVYVIEAQLPPLAPVSGIKLGLANIFTVYAVFAVGAGDGLAVLLARVILGSVFTAQPSALIYSLSGGLASFGLTVLLRRFFDSHRIWICSALAAAVHNLFQLLAAVAVTGTPSDVYKRQPPILNVVKVGLNPPTRYGGRYFSSDAT